MSSSKGIKTMLLAALLLVARTQAQVQLLNMTAGNSDASSTCLGVLNQQVTCDPSLASIGYATQGILFGTPQFLSSTQLTALCTTACASSLSTWERRIAGACGSTLYNTSDGGLFATAYYAQQYVELYNTLCLKNTISAGQYCNSVIGSLLDIDVTNQLATATPASTIYCDDCYFSLFSTQLAMPLASTTLLASIFTSISFSCSKTGWTLSPPPTATTFTVKPPVTSTAVLTCSGTTHTISSTDTCQGISMAEGISTDDLTIYNRLSSLCNYFPKTGTQLCIPSLRKCEPYTVTNNDTCDSLQTQFGLQYAQLHSWNPSLGGKCSNIAQYVGYVICVSNPGGTWVNPFPVTFTTTSSTFSSLWTTTLTPMSAYQTATYVASSDWVPFANDTRLDCSTYVTSPILTNYTGNGTTSLACQDVVDQYGINMSDFLSWNPSLDDSDSCIMANNTQYCVQNYPIVSPGITGACVQTATAPSGYDCYKFTSVQGIDPDQFLLWNPDVGADCANFKVGTQYCTAVLHYKQPGITSNCNKFATANQTDWVDLPCQILETQFGLSHARFIAWNPAVLDNCTELYYGYDYCVSIPNYRPTYTTTTTFSPETSTSTITTTTNIATTSI